MLQLPEVQEFVAETRERHALMTTRRARRYQRGSLCKSESGELWYGKYYPAPGAPQKRVQLGRTSEMDDKEARTALDDIVAGYVIVVVEDTKAMASCREINRQGDERKQCYDEARSRH